ncbi:mas-related G-protein coupled receptor member H-like [Sphaerodactylus townsendi]|uniref:mas-related G-protein coupled receptor member H-like n=1 Tax=Sphaerodactylus townsendi TaxID=933632 RepID=UPI002025B77F|nr:mas-related G-protein coupled receptor member H-like [Sphaerodactylus townsendi]
MNFPDSVPESLGEKRIVGIQRNVFQDFHPPEPIENQKNMMWKLENIHNLCFLNLENHQQPAHPIFNNTVHVSLVDGPNSAIFDNLMHSVIYSFTVIFCLFGLVGNGTVIWLLGFCLKRNPFTTYILNLAVADLGILLSLLNIAIIGAVVVLYKECHTFLVLSFLELFFFTCSVSQFLLAAISMDRCVSILFPLWHHCHRPSKLSSAVCVLVWILSFIPCAVHLTLCLTRRSANSLLYPLIISAFICTPLMVLSALILFAKVCCKLEWRLRGKLMTSILVAILVFLFFAFPLDIICIITYCYGSTPTVIGVGFLCTSLNSSINPVIYFLLGRKKKERSRVPVKVALQVVFKGEEDNMEEKKSNILQIQLQ